MSEIDDATMQALQAATFRRLIHHLMQDRPEVQNIDMMNLTGFCRNCLGRWLAGAAAEAGVDLGKEDARTLVYGMPYDQWKAQNQSDATDAQKAAFNDAIKAHEG